MKKRSPIKIPVLLWAACIILAVASCAHALEINDRFRVAITLTLAAADEQSNFMLSGGDTVRFPLDSSRGPFTIENSDPYTVSAKIEDNVLVLAGLYSTSLTPVEITVTAADGDPLSFEVHVDSGWPDYYYVEDPLIVAYNTLLSAYSYGLTYEAEEPPDDIRAMQTLITVINDFQWEGLWTLSNGMLKVGESIYCLPVPKIVPREDPAGSFFIVAEYSGNTLRVDPISPGDSNFNAWVVNDTEQIQISCTIFQ